MQTPIPATYMRGGTSKGTFFNLADLPEPCQVAGQARDAFLLRVVGSPDPYGKQIDGLGNGSSSTSKVVIISPCTDGTHDVNYLFGQVAIDKAVIDWSGNCGNLTGAVGSFAIFNGLIAKDKILDNGICTVRIYQQNIGKTIIAYVPIKNGQVVETGDFELDGVTFPASEIKIEFIDPVEDTGEMFPTGNLKDTLSVPDVGEFEVTLINAGIPTIFLRAKDLGFTGTELQKDINSNSEILDKLEKIRSFGAVKMGLIDDIEQAETRQHTPKIAWVAEPCNYVSSSGKTVKANDINLLVRAMSMGQLHHAMMGTASVAIGTAGTIVGTIVNDVAGGGNLTEVCFGHPSGVLTVGAQSEYVNGKWLARKVSMSRSARRLMVGSVFVPADCMNIE